MNERLKLLGLKNETAYEQFHEYFARHKLLAEYKALWEARQFIYYNHMQTML